MSAVSFDSAGNWDTRVPLLIIGASAAGICGALHILKPNVLKTPNGGAGNWYWEVSCRGTIVARGFAYARVRARYGHVAAVCTENWIRLDARQRLGNPAT